jgi:hypothetical protein
LRGQAEEAARYLVVDDKDEINHRWWLQGVAEGRLYLGDPVGALDLLDQLDDDEEGVDQTQQSWELLTRGMAEAALGRTHEAEEHLLATLTIARRTDYRIVQCFALVSLADLAAAGGRWTDVEEFVDQYFQVDEGGNHLTAGEAWRLRAMCAESKGQLDLAIEWAETAYRLCACDGPPFVFDAGLRRAGAVLERLGAYVPRTSNRLRPTWQAELMHEADAENELMQLAASGARQILLIRRLGGHPQPGRRVGDLVRCASEDDRRWWTLVAGDDRVLTSLLAARVIEFGLSIADLRRMFESSAEKSLEVLFFRLDAARVIEPDAPTPFGGLSPPERAAWLGRVDEHVAALEDFLGRDRALDTERMFRYQPLRVIHSGIDS